jgi:hypothetical protein
MKIWSLPLSRCNREDRQTIRATYRLEFLCFMRVKIALAAESLEFHCTATM